MEKLSGILFSFLWLFFVSACGFIGGVGSSFDSLNSLESTAGGPGDGSVPKLDDRISETPDLAEKTCEGNERCEETCRDIYEEEESYEECYQLKIKSVSDIENVFYDLLSAEKDKLEDIDNDDLETYIEVGVDGWKEKLISKQKEKQDALDRFSATLSWVAEETNVFNILSRRDRNNEILENLFLNYYEEACATKSDKCTEVFFTTPNTNNVKIGTTTNTKIVAKILKTKNKDLFKALSVDDFKFFKTTSLIEPDERAFSLGNDLIEKACVSNAPLYTQQCVVAFYCATTSTNSNDLNDLQEFLKRDKAIEFIGRTIELKTCDPDQFTSYP